MIDRNTIIKNRTSQIPLPEASPSTFTCRACKVTMPTNIRTQEWCTASTCQEAYRVHINAIQRAANEKRKAKAARMEALRAAGLA